VNEEKPKFCPLLSINQETMNRCRKEHCAWWTAAYTTKGRPVPGCAVVLLAGKNSDGKIVV